MSEGVNVCKSRGKGGSGVCVCLRWWGFSFIFLATLYGMQDLGSWTGG